MNKGDYIDKDMIIEWYRLMHLGRTLDDNAALYLKKNMGWSYHAACAGHDGIQLALGMSFKPNKDFLFPYYRDMLTVLAAGMTPEEIILNGLSKRDDPSSGGRHMSNHFAKPEIGIQNVSSATGNHTLHAAGVARAIKYYGSDAIAYSSQGESSTSEGYVYEAINGASREKLPVIFVIQNNGYGISVPVHEQTANPIVADNYSGLKNLHIVRVDGTDIFDSWHGMQEAIEFVKSGAGPAIVHAQTVRLHSHSNSDKQSNYRPEEELKELLRYDPVPRFRNYILSHNLLNEDQLAELEEKNNLEFQMAAERAENAPNPEPKSVYNFIMPDPIDVEETAIPESAEQVTLRHAINETLKQEFRRNPNTFLWGQDVASFKKGGAFKLTAGMEDEFGGERVFNGPIAEDYIVGTANGMSRYRDDIRIVIEGAQFADYFWPAMEQLIELSHEYWRSNGKFSPNVTIRLASGGYIGGGLYHSQNLEAILTALPGIRVVVPSFADDAAGLLRTSIRSRGLTLYLEPKFLYNHKMAKSYFTSDEHFVPFGKARIRKAGDDLSIITYGTPVHFSLKAAERLQKDHNISVEVVDLRSLVPLDRETILNSVRKTGRALVVHEDNITGGFGGEVASIISEQAFKFLDAPVTRLGSKDIPVGFNPILEREILINENQIYDKALQLAQF
ncbi:MAG: thiamine pyrophosphate-dependent enzyme [Calditrichaceae bacterium]